MGQMRALGGGYGLGLRGQLRALGGANGLGLRGQLRALGGGYGLSPRAQFRALFNLQKRQHRTPQEGILGSLQDKRKDKPGLRSRHTPIHKQSTADWRRPRLRFRKLPRQRDKRMKLRPKGKLNKLPKRLRKKNPMGRN